MSNRRARNRKKTAAPKMIFANESAYPSPVRSLVFMPSLDPRFDVSAAELVQLWAKSRVLVSNSPELLNTVHGVALLCGVIHPHPQTADAEWNALAREVFNARVSDPETFDAAGVENWHSVQLWLERAAVVDGDCLTVCKRGRDGGARFAFFEAPLIWSDWNDKNFLLGVERDADNHPLSYCLREFTHAEAEKSFSIIPAHSAILYRHNKKPGFPRGKPETAAALNNVQDIFDLNAFNKAAAKTAASWGIIETQKENDPAPGTPSFRVDRTSAAGQAYTEINGVRAISLPAGRDVKLLHDTRPSNEQRQFIRDLIGSIAYSMGLDPEVLFYVSSMGSASVRFSLAKLHDWVSDRLVDRQVWANRVWQHVIDCEIAAGRLRPCRDKNPASARRVLWIPRTTWTIDRGREGTLMINLVKEGLADANAWTLATTGRTVVELATDRAADVAAIRAEAEKRGLSLADILPGALGSTTTPGASSTPTPENEPTDSPEPEPQK